MATTDELQAITRALNQVKTAGQARGAIGAALRAISPAYELAQDLPSDQARNARNELDLVRSELERWFGAIKGVSAAAPFAGEWAANRRKVEKAYVVVAGIEGAASWKPQTSNLDILLTSIKEAPAVFGEAVGTVAKETGKAAGNVAGGVFAGLGVTGTIGLVVVVAVIVLVVTRGTIIGRLLSFGRGAA